MPSSRTKRIVLTLVALAVIISVALATVLLAYGSQDRVRPADVIIVLGAGEIMTVNRTDHGVALYHQGIAPWLLCSGGYRGANGIAEAELCAERAERAGVPASAIVLEPESRSTQQNAQNAAAIMRDRGWQSAVVVSVAILLRARWLFGREDITVWTSPAPGSGRVLDTLYFLVRESVRWCTSGRSRWAVSGAR